MGTPERNHQSGDGVGDVLRLAWPLIVSNSFWTLQILVDRVVLSRAAGEAVGASMTAALVFWTPLAILQNAAGYTSTFVAQYTGAGRLERTGPVTWQGLHVATVAGLAFLLLWPLAGPIFAWAGHTPHLQELETTYFRCLCFSALPTLWTAAACGFFAGRGESGTVLLINGTGLLVNVGLCILLVFGLAGFPALGIAGAGWATVIGSSVSTVLAVALMLRPRHRALGVWCWRIDPELLSRLLRFGVPNGLQVGLDTAAWTVFIFLLGRLGPAELSATTIAFSLNLIVYLPTMGIGQAVGVLIGQRLGEGRPDRAGRVFRSGLVPAMAMTGAMSILYLIFPGALASLFNSEDNAAEWEKVAALVPVLLRFVVVYCVFDTLNVVVSHALRGAGDTRFVTVVAVALAWPILVAPTWWVAQQHGSLYWPWTFATVYILLLAVVFSLRYRQGKWRSMRVIETGPGYGGEQGSASK